MIFVVYKMELHLRGQKYSFMLEKVCVTKFIALLIMLSFFFWFYHLLIKTPKLVRKDFLDHADATIANNLKVISCNFKNNVTCSFVKILGCKEIFMLVALEKNATKILALNFFLTLQF